MKRMMRKLTFILSLLSREGGIVIEINDKEYYVFRELNLRYYVMNKKGEISPCKASSVCTNFYLF